jgi:hypothetical protein
MKTGRCFRRIQSHRPLQHQRLEGDCIPGVVSIVPSTLFICPLYPPTSNQFRTARDLWNHETSPVHAPKLFYCPTALSTVNSKNDRKSAKQSFSTFIGLEMHVESGACGKQMFRWVLSLINERLQDVGIREIRLVS